MTRSWRMTVYDLDLDRGAIALPGGSNRFFYLRSGRAEARARESVVALEPDNGFFCDREVRFDGQGIVWIFETGPFGSRLIDHPAAVVVLSRRFALALEPPWLLRADRIESPSGAVTPRHGHRGPGMRRLIHGRLLAELGDDIARIEAGDAWFETGHDPVVGTNIHSGSSAFVRIMLLPIELQGGKSSFVPSSPEEAAKPRAVTNRLFGETVLEAAAE